jgi:hypothetical protein
VSVLLSVIDSLGNDEVFNLDDVKMILPVDSRGTQGPYVVVFADGREKRVSSFNYGSISHSASVDLGTAFGALDLTMLKSVRDVVTGPGKVADIFINVRYIKRVSALSDGEHVVIETISPNISYTVNASMDTVKPQLGIIQVDDQTN